MQYVGWVCCWFSPLLRGFSPEIPQKTSSTFPNSNSTRNGRWRTTMWKCNLKLLLHIYSLFKSIFLFYVDSWPTEEVLNLYYAVCINLSTSHLLTQFLITHLNTMKCLSGFHRCCTSTIALIDHFVRKKILTKFA